MGTAWKAGTLADLTARIYGAPVDPSGWPEVMRTIADGIGASVVGVLIHSLDGRTATTIAMHGEAPPPSIRRYEAYYAARNVWLIEGSAKLEPGAVLTGDELCPDEVFLRSEFYNDFLRPLSIRHSIRAVLGAAPEPLAYLFGARPQGRRPFAEVERRRLRALTGHLVQAVRIQAKLEVALCHERAQAEVMDRLPLGVFLLDARGRVVGMNAAARKIVEQRDGLILDRGVLVATETRADVALQTMIFGAGAAGSGRNLTLGGSCMLPRANGGHPLSAMVAPTGVTGIFPTSKSASVVVLVEEPVRRSAVPFDQFSSRFGLSRAEASVTMHLVGGLSLREAAGALGIQESTARSHLKRVFSKTGAKRQSDLIRRVLTQEAGER